MKRVKPILIVLSAAALPLAVFAACGRDNALVDGECAVGYTLIGNQCVLGCPLCDANVADVAGDEGSTGDGTLSDVQTPDTASDSPTVDAISCDDGLTLCNGTCVDTTTDPYNCGACNVVCPSLLCSNSLCQGIVPGSLVTIGHDYEVSYSVAQAKVLGNALLLASASSLRVRSYEQYASTTAVGNVKSILSAAAAAASRTITFTVATTPTDVSVAMTALNTDVLVIYDQVSAPTSTLATIGAGWSTAITNFTHVGGIVIALDGAGGTFPQMPALIQAASILDVTGDTVIAASSPLDVVAPADGVGLGVVSPYGSGKHSVFFACSEPNTPPVTYVVEDPAGDAGPTQPVVVHKVAP